ncbi:sigma-70 family RNA polymerase sigma factor [Paenibacillus koleovorans]|uniref:sigma-70 family RNA polymerase sigma factor n=1 Tax=Paenibacillus koleovorans TaxID=121608 RepID=UPI001FE91073|nr:sigma-70 family RNA polymerase sigma factor [Paenibacillus koleovorans]
MNSSLVKLAQRGDQNAYLQLFSQYEADIYRIAHVYLNHVEDALDVVQETAYRSYKSLPELREPSFFKTWLIRITIRCSIDLLRSRQRFVPLSHEFEEHLADDHSPPDIPLSISLQDMIDLLDESEKSVVLLRFYYDYTIRETAELLELPLGSAKTILYRALKKLRKQAEEVDWNER